MIWYGHIVSRANGNYPTTSSSIGNGNNGVATNDDRRAAEQVIEAFAAKQNDALLRVIDAEQIKEEDRKRVYDITPVDERAALDSLHAVYTIISYHTILFILSYHII